MLKSRAILPILLAAFAAFSGAAQNLPLLDSFLATSFPDNSDIRQKFFTSLITAPKETVWAFGEQVFPSRAGSVLVKTLQRNEDFFIQFVNGRDGDYPEAGRGSYLIERSAAKGYLVQAKIFLHDDKSSYARIYPQAEGSRLDLILYGAVVSKGIRISGMFYNVLTRPFSELVAATARSVDWEMAFGLGGQGSATAFAAALRGGGENAGRAGDIAALLRSSPSVEELLAGLAARGEFAAELSEIGGALGFAADREFLTTSLPYAAFPRYESGGGLGAAALRAALLLDSWEKGGSVYALFGAGIRILAAPSVEAGSLRYAFFSEGTELGWPELVAKLEGRKLRIIRL